VENYWRHINERVYHIRFGYGTCTHIKPNGNILVMFDKPTDGWKERVLKHTAVALVDTQAEMNVHEKE
jgi:hypothetical protein